jgi:transposase
MSQRIYTFPTIFDQDGEIVTQRRMPNEEVPDFLKPYGVEQVAMEATTNIAPLYRRLKQEEYDVLVSHPKKTRHIAEARIKTDKVDSQALAELLRLNSLPLSYVPPPHIAVLREKVRRRSFIVGQQTKFKIRSTLTYEGVKPLVEYGLFTRKGREWLTGLGLGPVDSYLRMMEPLRTEIRLLSPEMRHIAAGDEDISLLMTIPGVGYLHCAVSKGRDRRHQPVQIGGSAAELRGSRPIHPQQRRSHPPWPHHEGGVKVAQVGDGGGGSCSLQV